MVEVYTILPIFEQYPNLISKSNNFKHCNYISSVIREVDRKQSIKQKILYQLKNITGGLLDCEQVTNLHQANE